MASASAAAVASGSAAETVNSEDRPVAIDGECSWEPMVRRYFHMNLKVRRVMMSRVPRVWIFDSGFVYCVLASW